MMLGRDGEEMRAHLFEGLSGCSTEERDVCYLWNAAV